MRLSICVGLGSPQLRPTRPYWAFGGLSARCLRDVVVRSVCSVVGLYVYSSCFNYYHFGQIPDRSRNIGGLDDFAWDTVRGTLFQLATGAEGPWDDRRLEKWGDILRQLLLMSTCF